MNGTSLIGFSKAEALKRLEGLQVIVKQTETPIKIQIEKRVQAEEYVVREKLCGQFIELTVSKFI